jgi:hypothetical protein
MKLEHALADAGRYDSDAQFLLARVAAYPFLAQSPISVKPDIVPGDHVSTRLRAGWRVWGFRTLQERDVFTVQFGGRLFP